MLLAGVLVLAACSDQSNLERVDEVEQKEFGEYRTVGWLKNGKKHGQWFQLEGGKKRRMYTWVNGVQHGPEISWHPDGTVFTEHFYRHGLVHGRYRGFIKGKLWELGWYHHDRKEGTWCDWDYDGRRLEGIERWVNGKKVSVVENPDGPCPLLQGAGRRHADPEDRDYR